MEDTRGRCLVSPADCPAGAHLPAPPKAGVSVGGDFRQVGSAWAAAAPSSAPRAGHSSAEPAPEGRGAGLPRLRAPPQLALRRDGKSHPLPLLFFPSGPAWAPGPPSPENTHCLRGFPGRPAVLRAYASGPTTPAPTSR